MKRGIRTSSPTSAARCSNFSTSLTVSCILVKKVKMSSVFVFQRKEVLQHLPIFAKILCVEKRKNVFPEAQHHRYLFLMMCQQKRGFSGFCPVTHNTIQSLFLGR